MTQPSKLRSVSFTVRSLYRDIPHESASRALGLVFKRRGYIVIGTVPGPTYRIGQTIKQIFQYRTDREFVVSEFTTKRDMMEQIDMIAADHPEWTRLKMETFRGSKYYRIVPSQVYRVKKLPLCTKQLSAEES